MTIIVLLIISLTAAFFIVLYFLSAKRVLKLTAGLDGTAKKLKESQTALEEAKNVSEIKIQARTKELKELADSLEEKVKARTVELQGKIAELERFRKLAVGRELKMVELKEYIEKMEKQVKKNAKKK